MNRFISIAGAAALALVVSISTTTPSSADPAGDAVGAGIIGGMLGFMVGAAAGGDEGQPEYGYHPPRFIDGGRDGESGYHRDDYRVSDFDQHVQDCEDTYGWRYDSDTDLVTEHHHRFRCDL